ncbi:hypothetical protein [Catenovulum sediminis]|uniref:hypothetical protein n=1 Tax=Catenovulum sediminis TaxID=1740262 RepID=UPI00117C5D91|nr:hypothetical protein [Catenovulum sediminis]
MDLIRKKTLTTSILLATMTTGCIDVSLDDLNETLDDKDSILVSAPKYTDICGNYITQDVSLSIYDENRNLYSDYQLQVSGEGDEFEIDVPKSKFTLTYTTENQDKRTYLNIERSDNMTLIIPQPIINTCGCDRFNLTAVADVPNADNLLLINRFGEHTPTATDNAEEWLFADVEICNEDAIVAISNYNNSYAYIDAKEVTQDTQVTLDLPLTSIPYTITNDLNVSSSQTHYWGLHHQIIATVPSFENIAFNFIPEANFDTIQLIYRLTQDYDIATFTNNNTGLFANYQSQFAYDLQTASYINKPTSLDLTPTYEPFDISIHDDGVYFNQGAGLTKYDFIETFVVHRDTDNSISQFEFMYSNTSYISIEDLIFYTGIDQKIEQIQFISHDVVGINDYQSALEMQQSGSKLTNQDNVQINKQALAISLSNPQ